MNPIDFGGKKAKVTMDIYGNKLVNTIETSPLWISWSNLAEMLNHGKRIDAIDFGSQRAKVMVTVDTYKNVWK